ncbi:MAG: shikimate dehydrogenase [Candidatus Hadarchaeales archaeon]
MKVFALIGHPVKGSPSPSMHNAAFSQLGLDCVYVAADVPPPNLQDAVAGIRALGIAGANVTIPHKVAVMPFMDELHETASLVGAVNTIKNAGGKLIGFNTDGPGALRALKAATRVSGKKVLLLGAGGAARAIAFSIAAEGAELTIANRTIPRASALARDIKEKLGEDVRCVALRGDELSTAAMGSDIIINATSVGMYPESERTLLTSKMIPDNAVVFDIVYKPQETRLLREAKKAGAKTIRGVDMLVHQGALSFEIWTGKRAPVEVMRKAAQMELRRI